MCNVIADSRSYPRLIQVLLLLALFLGCLSAQSPDVLPLAGGNQWVLRSPYLTAPVVMEVVPAQQLADKSKMVVQFTNPWSVYSFVFLPTPTGTLLDGTVYNGVSNRFDDPVRWFPTDVAPGSAWTTVLGPFTLLSNTATVKTPRQTYQGCWHYRIGTGSGAQHWYLAPNVGFVQYGEGPAAFVLDTVQLNAIQPPAPPPVFAAPCPRVGIDANPVANGDFSDEGHAAAARQAFAAGARFAHISATWAELEPNPSTYSFSKIDNWTSFARTNGMDLALTIRTVDTTALSLPSDLRGRAINDPAVIARFQSLLSALAPRLNANVKWINLANEIDIYFSTNGSSLPAFQQFYAAGASRLKAAAPGVSVGVVFSYSAYSYNNAVFQSFSPAVEHIAFTYYPIRSDFSVRDPGVAASEIAEMAALSGSKKLLLTEIGYPSSTVLGSSLDKQAAFSTAVFDAIQKQGGHIVGASFFQMSDMPPATVNFLVSYYPTSNSQAFGAFLGSLGAWDPAGTPKPAWSTFSTRATGFLGPACTGY